MKSEKKDKRIGMICGIFTGSLWGLSGVFSQYLFSSTDMTSEWFVAVRMLLAGILMMGYTILTKKGEVCRMVTCKKDLFVCALTGIIGTMLFQFFCYGAVQCSNAATAIVLQYLCPVMVMVYACIKDRKLPQKKKYSHCVWRSEVFF